MPSDGAYNRRGGRSVAARQSAREDAEFKKSPEGKRHAAVTGDLSRQEGRIKELERRWEKLRGEAPIKVDDGLITLNEKGAGNPARGGGTDASGRLKFYGVKSGTFAAWMVVATDTTV